MAVVAGVKKVCQESGKTYYKKIDLKERFDGHVQNETKMTGRRHFIILSQFFSAKMEYKNRFCKKKVSAKERGGSKTNR